jgi:DNA repair protein RadC
VPLAALPEVLSSTASNHMVAHNHPTWNLMPSSGVSEDSYGVLTKINKILFFLKKKCNFQVQHANSFV